MSRKAKNNFFWVGKGIPKNDKKLIPIRSSPNSNIDVYDKRTGKLHRRRKFGKDGKVIKDYDRKDNHKNYDHAHDFYGNFRNTQDRYLTKKEKIEFNKAKKNRRIWND